MAVLTALHIDHSAKIRDTATPTARANSASNGAPRASHEDPGV
jgi:hypothetical protein